MSKEKMMMEYMIQDLVEIISDEQSVEYDEAMQMVYNSKLFDKIMDSETGLYRESPAYVYELLKDEKRLGKIVQVEV